MYREMLVELEQLAGEISPEELEVVAAKVLAGLEKMAEESEASLSKEADFGEFVDTTQGVLMGAGAIGGAVALRKAFPGIKADMAKGREAALRSKANRALDAADNIKSGKRGLGAAEGGYDGNREWKPNYDKKPITDPSLRVNPYNPDETMRKPAALLEDANKLQQADWVHKNKNKIALGLGAGAVIGGMHAQSEKQKAELQGAYGVARR